MRRKHPSDTYQQLSSSSNSSTHSSSTNSTTYERRSASATSDSGPKHDRDNADDEEGEAVRTIIKDVERTCTEVPYFRDGDGALVLHRLLLAFARLVPSLGYVQGMSNLAAFVLLTYRRGGHHCRGSSRDSTTASTTTATSSTPLDIEADAFWTFAGIACLHIRGYFKKGMASLLRDSSLLEALVEKHGNADAVKTLNEVDFDWLFVTPDW